MRSIAARTGLAVMAAVAAVVFGAARQPSPPTVALTVNAHAGRHAISPYIYGLNFAKSRLAAAVELPVDRWGGNSTDTYNWRLASYNTGLDYYFENLSDCFLKPGRCTPAYRTFVSADRARGTKTLLNLPLVGRVARNAPRHHPVSCGFPVSVYGPEQSVDPYDTNCGNGMSERGRPLSPRPARDSVAVGAAFYRGWLADLKRRYGTAARGGVAFYELGNEPSLWSSSHRDMHPRPETAGELWHRSKQVATLIRRADPRAKILGLSEWGWPGYFCTGADTFGSGCGADGCTTSPDCSHHGHLPTAAWLLKRFATYDHRTGTRHLNYLDLHYYAQGGTGPDVTRSLWDPSYTDPSWIDDQIDLIPRMKRWVARYYPGTEISLSEYNLSVTTDPVLNALIQADTLGIFAREGLNLAARWPLSVDGGQIGQAFKMYRDYDGHHSKFGDVWVSSKSADQSRLAIYGAQRSSDKAYTVLVINKTAGALRAALSLSGFSPARTASSWQWHGQTAIAHVPSTPIVNDTVNATYPGRSMTLYVIRSRRG